MKVLVCMIFFFALIGGCANIQTVKDAKGKEGISRIYQYPYDNVFSAALAAAKSKELDIVEADKQNGQIILSHGVTMLSWGERIAIFIKSLSPNTTEVQIVSKPILSPGNFPPDWQQILLLNMDINLRSGK